MSLLLTGATAADLTLHLLRQLRLEGWFAADEVLFLATCMVMLFGNIVHQLVRFGLAQRLVRLSHVDAAAQAAPAIDTSAPLVTIFVPAYKEEPAIVLRTLLSAVLQTHPKRRVVLLLDDPPVPATVEDAERLAAMRTMQDRIADLLAPLRQAVDEARADFHGRATRSSVEQEIEGLLSLATIVMVSLQSIGADWAGGDHTERFFAQQVASRAGRLLREHARQTADMAAADRTRWRTIVASEYDRLLQFFSADVAVFERKRFVNLSHEANKAMNLNSYIGCLGRNLSRAIGSTATCIWSGLLTKTNRQPFQRLPIFSPSTPTASFCRSILNG